MTRCVCDTLALLFVIFAVEVCGCVSQAHREGEVILCPTMFGSLLSLKNVFALCSTAEPRWPLLVVGLVLLSLLG